MHIRKYDEGYSRRAFLEQSAKGVAMGGMLAPLWSTIAKSGTIDKVYPDELLSIELYTKGKVKPGDVITAENVEFVADLLDPVALNQVKTMGRRINIVETTTDMTKLFPHEYLEATLRNQGQAKFGPDGNVYTQDGQRWIGGNPFPDAKTGEEAIANLSLSWGRHDESVYAVRDVDIGPDGGVSYRYDFIWAEQNTAALTNAPSPYLEGEDDKLRYQAVWFTSPADTKGTAFLNTWYYDQRKFPDLIGYLPAFKRVRRFPTNQRFEPLVPGITLFLSDAWAAGDPYLTWGNYKVVGTKPHLGSVSKCWMGHEPNWEHPTHGGPQGNTFQEDFKELVPEVLVVDAEPVGYPRAPVGKKRMWIDMRNQMFIAYITYDRRGEMWKSFEAGFSQYATDDGLVEMDGSHPVWSWTHVMSHDIQANRMSLLKHAQEITGGYRNEYNIGPDAIHETYLTPQAVRRFGT